MIEKLKLSPLQDVHIKYFQTLRQKCGNLDKARWGQPSSLRYQHLIMISKAEG